MELLPVVKQMMSWSRLDLAPGKQKLIQRGINLSPSHKSSWITKRKILDGKR